MTDGRDCASNTITSALERLPLSCLFEAKARGTRLNTARSVEDDLPGPLVEGET